MSHSNAEGLRKQLRIWRLAKARELEHSAFCVFPDTTLDELVTRRPRTRAELIRLDGLGPKKANKYGEALLRIIRAWSGEPAPSEEDLAPVPERYTTKDAPQTLRSDDDRRLWEHLHKWRADKAKELRLPVYCLFKDKVIDGLVEQRPKTRADLLRIHGIGPDRANKYGESLVRIIRAWSGDKAPSKQDLALVPATTASGDPIKSYRAVRSSDLWQQLDTWRCTQAQELSINPISVCSVKTMEGLVKLRPRKRADLLKITGIGPKFANKYGEALLRIIRASSGEAAPSEEDLVPVPVPEPDALGDPLQGHQPPANSGGSGGLDGADDLMRQRLEAWRAIESRERVHGSIDKCVPDEAIEDLVAQRPRTRADLLRVAGIGPIGANKYGEELLRIVRACCGEGPPSEEDLALVPLALARKGMEWTPEETESLQRMVADGEPLKVISAMLSRASKEVRRQLKVMGVPEPLYTYKRSLDDTAPGPSAPTKRAAR